MFLTLVKNNMSFKTFTCSELFPDTPCCEDKEQFCFMRNEPGVPGAVLRVEVRSCCKHAHKANKLPIEFFIEHHRPYVMRECAKTPSMKKSERAARGKGEDDDWLW